MIPFSIQVVAKERPDLEKLKKDLTRQQNEFKITLKSLEVRFIWEAKENFSHNHMKEIYSAEDGFIEQ